MNSRNILLSWTFIALTACGGSSEEKATESAFAEVSPSPEVSPTPQVSTSPDASPSIGLQAKPYEGNQERAELSEGNLELFTSASMLAYRDVERLKELIFVTTHPVLVSSLIESNESLDCSGGGSMEVTQAPELEARDDELDLVPDSDTIYLPSDNSSFELTFSNCVLAEGGLWLKEGDRLDGRLSLSWEKVELMRAEYSPWLRDLDLRFYDYLDSTVVSELQLNQEDLFFERRCTQECEYKAYLDFTEKFYYKAVYPITAVLASELPSIDLDLGSRADTTWWEDITTIENEDSDGLYSWGEQVAQASVALYHPELGFVSADWYSPDRGNILNEQSEILASYEVESGLVAMRELSSNSYLEEGFEQQENPCSGNDTSDTDTESQITWCSMWRYADVDSTRAGGWEYGSDGSGLVFSPIDEGSYSGEYSVLFNGETYIFGLPF